MDKKLNNLNYIRTKTYQRNEILEEVFNEKTLNQKNYYHLKLILIRKLKLS